MIEPSPLNPPDPSSSPRNSRVWNLSLFAILVVALLGRLIVLHSIIVNRLPTWLFSHPYEMAMMANSILHGHGLSSPFGIPTGPTALIAPGYPVFIAAVFLVFGSNTYASAVAIIVLQILIGLLTIWLIMRIGRQWFDHPTAILAGAFWAVSLPLLWIPAIFWETSLSACALPAIILFALRCSRAPTVSSWILLGSSSAMVALINPALLPSLVAIMAWAAWQTRRATRTASIIGFLALILLFSPWPIRNALRLHAFVPLRTTTGFELWMGNRPGATGYLDESLFPMYNPSELASYVAKGEIAYTSDKSSQAWQYIRAHPAIFLNLTLRRFFRFWSGTGNLNSPRIDEVLALLSSLFGFAGLALLYRNRSKALALLMALPLLLFPLPYYITHAELRYRLNIDPLLTLLAAYAVTHIATRFLRPSRH